MEQGCPVKISELMKVAILLTVSVIYLSGLVYGQQTIHGKHSPVIPVDYRALVSQADLVYQQAAERSEAGMPIGNGRMGSLVWTSPSALRFQINRVDVFGNNSASNNFYQRNTDYCGGAGFVDIDFGQEVFTGKCFRQKLSCYDGLVTVDGTDIKAQVLAWHDQDVMAVKVKDNRAGPGFVDIDLRMLRNPVVHRGNHSAISRISSVNNRTVLTQQFSEDNYYCGSAVVIGVKGRDVKAELANETTVRLMVPPGKEPYSIFIASAASFDPAAKVADTAMDEVRDAEAKGFGNLVAENEKWWHHFWSEGFIRLHSADGVADDI